MSYIGTPIPSDYRVNTYEYTATSGQTSFACVYGNYVEVYLNGFLLSIDDYVATSKVDIILNQPCSGGELIAIKCLSNLLVTVEQTKNTSEKFYGLSEQIIDAFKMSEYRSAEYVITCSSSYGFMSLKMLVLHDDVNVYDTVYGQIGETLGTFSTTISDSYVNVLFTPSYDGVEVTYNKIMIENTII